MNNCVHAIKYNDEGDSFCMFFGATGEVDKVAVIQKMTIWSSGWLWYLTHATSKKSNEIFLYCCIFECGYLE